MDPPERPKPHDVVLWKDTPRKLFLQPLSMSKRLRKPLGKWLSATPDYAEWTWWRDEATDTVLQCELTHFRCWTRAQATGPHAKYIRSTLTMPLTQISPQSVRVTTIFSLQDARVTVLNSSPMQPPPPLDAQTTLLERLQNLPPSAKWAVEFLKCDDDGDALAIAIRHGTANCVSDGSCKLLRGTAAFITQGLSSQHTLRAVNRVPGPLKAGDSHRCELAGLYGSLLAMQTMCTHHEITDGHITIACDNMRAMESLKPGFNPQPRHANFDLASTVVAVARSLPMTIHAEHVKGHQDTNASTELTLLEQLNVHMDALAKKYWNHCYSGDTPLPLPRSICKEGWQTWTDAGIKLTQPSVAEIYQTVMSPQLQQWWTRHELVPSETVQAIDWPTTRATMLRLTPKEHSWVTKTASENCGVGATLVM